VAFLLAAVAADVLLLILPNMCMTSKKAAVSNKSSPEIIMKIILVVELLDTDAFHASHKTPAQADWTNTPPIYSSSRLLSVLLATIMKDDAEDDDTGNSDDLVPLILARIV
jgi:hypothetical protein